MKKYLNEEDKFKEEFDNYYNDVNVRIMFWLFFLLALPIVLYVIVIENSKKFCDGVRRWISKKKTAF